jgi:hypothetical protein
LSWSLGIPCWWYNSLANWHGVNILAIDMCPIQRNRTATRIIVEFLSSTVLNTRKQRCVDCGHSILVYTYNSSDKQPNVTSGARYHVTWHHVTLTDIYFCKQCWFVLESAPMCNSGTCLCCASKSEIEWMNFSQCSLPNKLPPLSWTLFQFKNIKIVVVCFVISRKIMGGYRFGINVLPASWDGLLKWEILRFLETLITTYHIMSCSQRDLICNNHHCEKQIKIINTKTVWIFWVEKTNYKCYLSMRCIFLNINPLTPNDL